jgi:hypothetical protein
VRQQLPACQHQAVHARYQPDNESSNLNESRSLIERSSYGRENDISGYPGSDSRFTRGKSKRHTKALERHFHQTLELSANPFYAIGNLCHEERLRLPALGSRLEGRVAYGSC